MWWSSSSSLKTKNSGKVNAKLSKRLKTSPDHTKLSLRKPHIDYKVKYTSPGKKLDKRIYW